MIARIVDDRVLLDLRTVEPEQERDLIRRLAEAAQSTGGEGDAA